MSRRVKRLEFRGNVKWLYFWAVATVLSFGLLFLVPIFYYLLNLAIVEEVDRG